MDSNFILNSDWNYQKVYTNTSGSLSVPSGSSANYTVTHNIGSIVSARVWIEGASGKWFPVGLTQLIDHSARLCDYTGSFYLTTTTLVLTIYNASASTASVNYRIMVYYDD